jgi:gliotoxin/aspirochlorine biosynthesis glutathione S-transferase
MITKCVRMARLLMVTLNMTGVLFSTSSKVPFPEWISHGQFSILIYKADQTSYINYIKPLIFAEELQFPHLLSVIDTKDEWFYSIHPERMVPSLRDQDPVTKEKVVVFESTATLQYLADRFDTDGTWSGRTAFEKGAILSWTAYQTAALG